MANEPYGGGPVPLTGTDVSNGDLPLSRRYKKLRFFQTQDQLYSIYANNITRYILFY